MSRTATFPPAPAAERLARAVAIMRRARTSAQVLSDVPRSVAELGFERVMVSVVDKEYWRPQAVHIVSDQTWSDRVLDRALGMPQPIELTAPEKRVIERASPLIVPPPRDVHPWSKETWDYRHPPKVTAYLASPIVVGGRVIGIVHADRGTSCQPLNRAHVSLLWSFCGVVELAFAAAEAEERIDRMRENLDAMLELTNGVRPRPAARIESPAAPLSALAQTASPRAQGTDIALTSRERHILELIARGLSNAQIAEQLVVAEGTVKAHVKHVLAKTGSANRTAAALKWTRGEVS